MAQFYSKYLFILLSLVLITPCFAQKSDSANRVNKKEAVKIIFDTDISGDWDDVGATATLLSLSNMGEAEILAMGVSAGGYAAKWSPLCLDAINTYYGQPDIPIGVVKNIGSTWSPYAKEIAENWPHDLQTEDVWDATELYRKILSEQADTSVVLVSVGYLSNIKDLLQSTPDKYSKLDGIALVEKKVKKWVCMGGKFPKGGESNFWSIPTATKFALENWPRPALFSGIVIGSAFSTGQGLVRTSYDNPVRRAYEICGGRVGHPHANWDQTAVLAAVRNPELYWDLSENGTVFIMGEGGENEWKPTPDRKHQYLIKREDNADEIGKLIDSLMCDIPPFNLEGLTASWKFNEISTDIIEDASGNGHTGVFVGEHSWVKGKYGNAACFGEGSKYMFVNNSLDFKPESKSVTIAFWVFYPESVPTDKRVLVKHNVAISKWLGVWKNAADNKVGFSIKLDSIISNASLTANSWHHIAVTLNSDLMASIYIDGVLDVHKKVSGNQLWSLGDNGYMVGANIGGKVVSDTYFDDLFIFNRALSADEIDELIKKEFN